LREGPETWGVTPNGLEKGGGEDEKTVKKKKFSATGKHFSSTDPPSETKGDNGR